MQPLAPALTRGSTAVQRRLSPSDTENFPTLTEAGIPSTAYQLETATGLVSAMEAEAALETHTRVDDTNSNTTRHSYSEHHEDKLEKALSSEAKIVTWKEHDPENPRNWGNGKKWLQTIIPSILCFTGGLASSIITGGLAPVQKSTGASEEVVNLTVALFVVGFGVGPMVAAPISEMYGRRVVYVVSMLFYTLFTIPNTVSNSIAVLVFFRFLAGLMASTPMTNCGGSIADLWSVETRGNKMAVFSAILFAAPCLGPPIGGYIAMYTQDWHWIYIVLVIFSAVVWIASTILLKETFAPVILRRRAEKLRAETGDPTIVTEQERRRRPFSDIVKEALLRPFVMLFTEPVMIFFSAYLCLIYGLLYGFFFAVPIVFEQGHHFNPGQTGLVFFGILIGIMIVVFITCPFQERYFQSKFKESSNGEVPPETRLPLMMGCSTLLPISLFIFSWTSLNHVSWVGPAVAGIPFGFALVGIYISANTYLVDCYPGYGASALAAKTFIRSMAGASVPMWIAYLYRGAGNGWAGSVFAFVSLGMAPIPFIFYFKGPSIRIRSALATHI